MTRKAASEAVKLQRRLNTYPAEMYEILKKAMEGLNYERQFPTHAEANAYLHRYYRFRMDILEARPFPGIEALTGMRATGTDGAGEKFDSKRTDAPGPFTITWHNDNSFNARIQVEAEIPSAEALSFTAAERKPADAAEDAVKRYMSMADPTAPACPQGGAHEWDTMLTRCLKCEQPHPDMKG